MEFIKHRHYSEELETCILGICMLEKSAFGRTYGLVTEDSFYFVGHQEVYRSLKIMYESGLPIDIETTVDHLMRVRGLNELNQENIPYFLMRMTNAVVSSAHIEYHCHIIKSMWMEREIIKLTHGGVSLDGSVKDQIFGLQSRLQELNQRSTESDWKDMTELMVDMYKHQAEMEKTSGMGMTTGFNGLDKQSGGFHPGQLIVIGARPSVGKSALAGQMAIEMAKAGKTVGIVSLEMHNNEIAARLASIDTDTDFAVLYRGLYADENQRHRVYKRIGEHTAGLKIFVSDKTDVNINEIRAKAVKLKHLHGLDCLMIDYLQLIDSEENRNSNRENEIRKISRGAKILAKEMGIPVIEICQLNREVSKRTGQNRYPVLSDLRESGSIEQDADIVMFLHRDYLSGMTVDEQGNSTETQADLVIRKWRNGNANFILPLDFDPPKMKFTERKVSSLSGNWKPVNPNQFIESKKDEPF